MYHVFSTGIIATVLYLLSYTFCRIGFFNLNTHRKIWNTILAVVFIGTILAGLFVAMQINFKWNIPFIKTVLKWHVETGIGFSFTGLFHFSWHLRYFKKTSDLQTNAENIKTSSAGTANQYRINLFLAGFLSSSVQLLMMREMMNISGGYELVTGVFLGSWLIASATGSYLAKRSVLNNLRIINTVLAVSAFFSLLLMIVLCRLMFQPGETPSFLETIFFTLVVLMPFCFTSGFTFIKILKIALASGTLKSGESFSTETAGGIASGILIAVFAHGILNTYQLFLLVLTAFLVYLLSEFYLKSKTSRTINAAAGFTLAVVIILTNPDNFFRQQLLQGISVINSEDSPYGNITTSEYGGEKSLFYNQRLLAWEHDEIEREENIHYAMLQSHNPEKVLLLSGDMESSLRELLKYPVKKIYYVERDPEIIRNTLTGKESFPDFLQIENWDAYRFIREMEDKLDVVILNLPPPSTLSINRYYTTNFFREVKNKLNTGGYFVCSPGPGENYFNKQSAALYSSIYRSLSSVFTNVVPVIGNKLYLIASDDEVNLAVCSLVEQKGIENVYVCSDFLSDENIAWKSSEFTGIIDVNAMLNTIEVPVACFLYQSYNLSKNLNETIPALIFIVLIFLLPVSLTGFGSNIKMYTAAASLAGFEIILLLLLQSSVGNMYQLSGLVIAGFMAGLAAGAGTKIKLPSFTGENKILIALLIIYFVAGILIRRIIIMENRAVILSIILVASLIPSFFTGYLFQILTASPGRNREPGKIYSSDLAGSALGFVAISGIILPLAGIRLSVFLLSAIILSGLVLGSIRNKY